MKVGVRGGGTWKRMVDEDSEKVGVRGEEDMKDAGRGRQCEGWC